MMTAGRKIFEHGARQSTGSPPAALALAPHRAPSRDIAPRRIHGDRWISPRRVNVEIPGETRIRRHEARFPRALRRVTDDFAFG
tara:strand:+ start:265 stop:516 length:252 start_codon:yes stop_codon:yes gene_type:complete